MCKVEISYVYFSTFFGKNQHCPKGNIKETEITYPILKACGISNLIEPDVMYHAIDEYFSLMKQTSETTVAQGTTNEDKIVNHGFDKKTSFRGKNKK